MRRYFVTKSSLKGTIAIPPSKSQTLRAILFGALGCGNEHMIKDSHILEARLDLELSLHWYNIGANCGPRRTKRMHEKQHYQSTCSQTAV